MPKRSAQGGTAHRSAWQSRLWMEHLLGRGCLSPPYLENISLMPNYLRYHVPGGTYFFTIVTCGRRPILTTELGRDCLAGAISDVRNDHPFNIIAIVLLPDHWHTVWALPPGD